MKSAEETHTGRHGVLVAVAAAALVIIAAGYGMKTSASKAPGSASTTPPPQGAIETHVPPGAPAPKSLREAYPDYRPEDRDPEHAAAVRGRRDVPVNPALTLDEGGSSSIQSVIEQAIAATDLGDYAVFERLCITRSDFEKLLWPEFPQSRPAANVPALEAWDFLHTRNAGGFSKALGQLHGKGIRLKVIRPGVIREYTNFRFHEDIEVDVNDETGAELDFPLVRTIVERNGRFKIYAAGD